MSDFAESLVDHALGLSWAKVPERSRRAATGFLQDTLAVGVAGARAAHAEQVLAIARAWGEGGAAGVLGQARVTLPATSAAFVNAFQIHGQEFDCVHEPAVLHPMASAAAVLLADLARGPVVSGADMLTAIVAGVDVAVSLGLAATGPLSFFRPATAGIFGGVAAIANLRRPTRDQALDAFGHALAFAAGTMQAHVEGKPALPLQVANAARNALVAVDLARAGIPGVRQPIEGPSGYAALFEASGAFDPPRARLGDGHRIDELSWKPFPTGRAAHGGLAAIGELLGRGIAADAVAAIVYHAPPLIARLVGRPAQVGMTPGYARLCLPWLGAVLLAEGELGLAQFTPERLDDPDLVARAGRIAVVADGNPDPAAFVPARLVARLIDGREIEVVVNRLEGCPDRPPSEAQRRAKMVDCLRFAGLERSEGALADAVTTLADAPDALRAIRATGIIA